MVRRGLVSSRASAQAVIGAGIVLVSGSVATKASRLVHPAEPVELARPPAPFVSRGGSKLAAALEFFAIEVGGVLALDAGASTGGFTDCLLQAGAARVVSLDVGYGQIHERLRADERVSVHERTNIRSYEAEEGPFDIVVADLSFISLTATARALVGAARPGAPMVVLVKPQFEAGRVEVSKGQGVISDPATWERTITEVGVSLLACGAVIMGAMVSPLKGADGNTEFFLYCQAPGFSGRAPVRQAGSKTGVVRPDPKGLEPALAARLAVQAALAQSK